MKKTRLLSIAAISLMISLVGCNWQIPENVAVKTNAEYEFSAGSFNKSLDEYLDIKKMLGNNQGLKDKGIEIYDYFPGKANPNLQQYLMKVPLADIPIDLDSFMAKIDLTNGLKAMEFNHPFTIPTFSIDGTNNDIKITGVGSNVNLPIAQDFDPIQLPDQKLQDMLPTSTGVVSCIIEEGSIDVEVKGLNSDATYEYEITASGGLALEDGSGSVKTITNTDNSLKGAKIKSGETIITAKITLKNVKEISSPTISIIPKITKLASITLDLGKDVKTDFNNSYKLPEEITNIVKKIKLAPSGFDLTYTNELPARNDITLNVVSQFLGIEKNNVKLSNKTEKIPIKSENGHIVDISKTNNVDFKVEMGLPNKKGSQITINGIELGKTYNIGMKLDPVIDWESVTLNPAGLNSIAGDKGLSNTVDLQVNLHKMLTDLGNNFGNPNLFTRLQIKELPIYLFCTKPTTVEGTTDPLENLQFSGTGKLMVGTTPVGYILGDGKIEGQLSPVAKLPDLKIENGIVTRDFKNIPDNEVSLKPKGLAESIKTIIGNDGNLSLDYNLKIEGTDGEITLEKASLQGKSNISLVAYIDLGFALGVDNDIDISLASLMKLNPNKDILDGNLKMMKDKGIDKYLEAIDEVAVNYNLNAIPYHPDENTKDIGIYVKIAGLDQMDFGLHGGKIAITKKQVLDLLNAKDPALKMEGMGVVIPKGSFSIPRNKNVSASLGVNISTDGTVTLIENGQPAFGGTK